MKTQLKLVKIHKVTVNDRKFEIRVYKHLIGHNFRIYATDSVGFFFTGWSAGSVQDALVEAIVVLRTMRS